MKKQLPKLKTDKEAEDFLEGDLSNLDFSQFQPVRFEFEKKNEQINMRVSGSLMAAVRARAKARGIPYTRFIRETLERAVAGAK
jgi:predicted DNA binding CopG/RHH family protein